MESTYSAWALARHLSSEVENPFLNSSPSTTVYEVACLLTLFPSLGLREFIMGVIQLPPPPPPNVNCEYIHAFPTRSVQPLGLVFYVGLSSLCLRVWTGYQLGHCQILAHVLYWPLQTGELSFGSCGNTFKAGALLHGIHCSSAPSRVVNQSGI